jgi:hypothetical protein
MKIKNILGTILICISIAACVLLTVFCWDALIEIAEIRKTMIKENWGLIIVAFFTFFGGTMFLIYD